MISLQRGPRGWVREDQPSETASGGRQGERRKVGDQGCGTEGGEQRTARRGCDQDRRQGLGVFIGFDDGGDAESLPCAEHCLVDRQPLGLALFILGMV